MGNWNFGVVLDAGSSGTRLHVYRWLKPDKAQVIADDSDLHRLPQLETFKKWTKKTHPGISTFSEQPWLIGPDHLHPLLDHALSVVDKEEVPNTPIFLFATAGMRLLPPFKRDLILAESCNVIRNKTNFNLPDCNVNIQVITGKMEGIFGWIASNYLLHRLEKPYSNTLPRSKKITTYGFLDMGGASSQIAFIPNTTESTQNAEDLTLVRLRFLDGSTQEYRVFVESWLGFGANVARQRYVQSLIEEMFDAQEIPDPCLPRNLLLTVNGEIVKKKSQAISIIDRPLLSGTGDFRECLKKTFFLMRKNATCKKQPCLVNGSHVPNIDFKMNKFVGVSEYWYITHDIFKSAHAGSNYDANKYEQAVAHYCEQTWHRINKGLKKNEWIIDEDRQKAIEICFKASWMINLVHEGIGIPRGNSMENSSLKVGHREGENMSDPVEKGNNLIFTSSSNFQKPFQVVDKVNNIELSWTMGKMVLYASSQVPLPAHVSTSSGENLAGFVGFGSNFEGVERTEMWQDEPIGLPQAGKPQHKTSTERLKFMQNNQGDIGGDAGYKPDSMSGPEKTTYGNGTNLLPIFLFLVIMTIFLFATYVVCWSKYASGFKETFWKYRTGQRCSSPSLNETDSGQNSKWQARIRSWIYSFSLFTVEKKERRGRLGQKKDGRRSSELENGVDSNDSDSKNGASGLFEDEMSEWDNMIGNLSRAELRGEKKYGVRGSGAQCSERSRSLMNSRATSPFLHGSEKRLN